jgi:hypothetical protein
MILYTFILYRKLAIRGRDLTLKLVETMKVSIWKVMTKVDHSLAILIEEKTFLNVEEEGVDLVEEGEGGITMAEEETMVVGEGTMAVGASIIMVGEALRGGTVVQTVVEAALLQMNFMVDHKVE